MPLNFRVNGACSSLGSGEARRFPRPSIRMAWAAVPDFDPFNGAFLLPTPPLSAYGASPDFSKLYLETRVTQPLVEEVQLALVAKAQTGFGAPLVLAEQFSLDGYNGVSGFAVGTLNVDRGVVVRGELSRPFSFNLF